MLRILNLAKQFGRKPLNAKCLRRAYHRKEFLIQSDFFDTHPIDRQTIEALAKLDSERKSGANIEIVRNLHAKFESETDTKRQAELATKLRSEIKKFPNQTHPTVLAYGPNAAYTEVESHGDAFEKKNPDGMDYVTLCNLLNTVRLDHLGNFTGSRSYYFMQSVAEMVRLRSIQMFKTIILLFQFLRNKPSSGTRTIF